MFLFNKYGRFFYAPDDGTGNGGGTSGGGEQSALDKTIDRGEIGGEGESSTSGEGEGTTQEGQQTQQGQQGQQGTGRGATPNQGAKPGQTQARQQAAGAGDLKLQDGTVIRAGAERRMYERMQQTVQQHHSLTQQHQQATQKVAQLEGELQGFRQANQAMQQLGITPQEAAIGYNFVAEFKKDAVGTVKKLLEHVRSQGHNVEGIGQTVDMGAIQRMIQQQLQPITSHHQTLQQQQVAEQQAAQEYNNFVTRYPDARLHEGMLAEMLNRDTNLSLDAAYFQLQLWATRNGLDWTQPLPAQIQARQNGQGNGQQQTRQQTTLPNGRGGAAQFNGNAVGSKPKSASADASWDDIISETFQEVGFRQ